MPPSTEPVAFELLHCPCKIPEKDGILLPLPWPYSYMDKSILQPWLASFSQPCVLSCAHCRGGTGPSADECDKARDLPCTGNPWLMLLLKLMIIMKCPES